MKISRPLLLAAIVVAGSLQFGSSCASDGGNDGGGYDSGSSRGPVREPTGPVYRDPEYRNDRDESRPNRIPRGADLVRSGSGKLRWEADLDGDLYIYDIDRGRIVYQGPIKRNQEVIVHPDEDHVYIDDRTVSSEDLRRDDRHEIYFVSSRTGSGYGRGNSGHDSDYYGRGSTGSGRPDQPSRDHNTPSRDESPVPRGAQRLAQGDDDVAIAECPNDGTIYVYDESDRKLITTVRVRKGNSFQIFPSKSVINLNSKRTATATMRRGHNHILYFVANPKGY